MKGATLGVYTQNVRRSASPRAWPGRQPGVRWARGRASRTRSRGQVINRPGWSRGLRRARRTRHRHAGPGGAPLDAMRTSWSTAESSVSNGLSFKIFLLRYSGMNCASTSSREKPKLVCVRSLVPKQKKSACWAISSADGGARQLDHACPRDVELDAVSAETSAMTRSMTARGSGDPRPWQRAGP